MNKLTLDRFVGDIQCLCVICDKPMVKTSSSNFMFLLETPGTFFLACNSCEPLLDKIVEFARNPKDEMNPLLDHVNAIRLDSSLEKLNQ